jgi:hypothetical protein
MAQVFAAFALANLYLLRQRLRPAGATVSPLAPPPGRGGRLTLFEPVATRPMSSNKTRSSMKFANNRPISELP